MARTWTDTARCCARSGEKVPGLAARTAALAVTGQGDGTWLIDGDGRARRDGWLWLDATRRRHRRGVSTAPGLRRSLTRRPARGLNVCQQGPQLIWLAAAPAGPARRADDCVPLKDWLYFSLTGERVTDPPRATFTFGDFPHARLRRRGPRRLWASRELQPPAAADASTAPSSIIPDRTRPRAMTGLPPGRRSCSAISTCSAPGSAAGSTIRAQRRLHDHRLDRHAHAPRPRRRRAASTPSRTRLHDGVPGRPALAAQMQSNMAATLNIDWLLDARRRGVPQLRATISQPDRARCAARRGGRRGEAGAGALPSLYLRGRRARALRRPERPRPDSSASRTPVRLRRHGARGLRRPRLRRARLLRRDGRPAARGAPRRRRRALQALRRRSSPASLGAPVARPRRARSPGPPARR